MNLRKNPKSNKKAIIISLAISISIYLLLSFFLASFPSLSKFNLDSLLYWFKNIFATLTLIVVFLLLFILLRRNVGNVSKIEKDSKISINNNNTENGVKNFQLRYKALAEVSKDGVFITTQAGKIIECNQIACQIFDYDRSKLIGMYVKELIPDSNKIDLSKIFSNKTDYNLTYFEAEGKKHNGTTFPLEANVKLINVENEAVFISCVRDVSRNKMTEEQIKESIEEREILIKEVHHRVKNNLQIISSLINLQTRYLSNQNSIIQLKETKNRVISMALIHEILYQSESVSRINFQKYINSLVKNLVNAYKVDTDRIEIEIRADDIYLDLQKGIPCSLIMNELISNCFKYAFPDKKPGKIIISLKKQDEEYTLIIKDNGIGLPSDIDFETTKTVGLQLVNVLTIQIKGEVSYKNDDGVEFVLKFKE
jgi:PAS domain S-box-containing protein